MIPFAKPSLNFKELNQIKKVMNSGILVHGNISQKFEFEFSKFTKSKFALSVSSCTSGLYLLLKLFGIQKGDEVIVSNQTHVASANVIEEVGAKPIFIDSEIHTGNINVDLIESQINKKTKAIIVAHYIGMPANMEKLVKIKKRFNLKLIEDCATSLGSKYKNKHVGNFGDGGVFSFYPVKLITSGEGGMIIVNNKNYYEKLKYLRAFGVNKNYRERLYPDYDCIISSINFRMSEVHAAIGLEQLKKFKSFYLKRKKNFEFLQKKINKIESIYIFPQNYNYSKGSYYALSILLNKYSLKKLLMKYLKEKKIQFSVYYPKPVSHMTYYKKKYGYNLKEQFLVSNSISKNMLCLPIGPHITKSNLIYIYKNIFDFFNSWQKK